METILSKLIPDSPEVRIGRLEKSFTYLHTDMREIKDTQAEHSKMFVKLDEKIDGVEARLDQKIDGVEERLDRKIDQRFNELTRRMDVLEDTMEAGFREMREGFAKIFQLLEVR